MGKKVPPRTVPKPLTPEAQQFIEQGGTAQAPKRVTAQEPKEPAARAATSRSTVERADGRKLRRIQIYFDTEVAKRLKVHCAAEDVDMSEFVNELVDKTLGKPAA